MLLLDVTIMLCLALTLSRKMLPLPKRLLSHRSYLLEVEAVVGAAEHKVDITENVRDVLTGALYVSVIMLCEVFHLKNTHMKTSLTNCLWPALHEPISEKEARASKLQSLATC